ncbi:MAG TPA: malto-oligosyltrehalose trehalohydrolase [Acidimicrobiales bacterium]|nr:malto-oligosyltrehalose trehalohydrolase [Acidimicrobiales bacterium]
MSHAHHEEAAPSAPPRWGLIGVPAVPGGELPLGVVPGPGRESHVTVWAPKSATVSVRVLADPARLAPLGSCGDGYHRGWVSDLPAGTRYRLVVDDGRELADPASRSQPDGVAGPSAVFDPSAHRWEDAGFVAKPLWQHVIYEAHIGTLTPGGSFDSAIEVLDELADLGITAVEPLPIAQFSGTRNWGYDGVFPYAVQHSYGGPAAFQRFVDAAHQRGIAVVLDVVYNHVGPEGNVLGTYAPYFTDRYRTPWGEAINFDGPGSDQVRRYFVENALTWFRDFHVDALRLDAVHGIVDPTAVPFLAELAGATEQLGTALGRRLELIAESADNDPRVVSPRGAGGLGLDAQWNDDFHHALHAALTGERLGYYSDFGEVGQLARSMSQGFVYQGQYSRFRSRRHGASSAGIEPERFVVFAQNHDHVGNRPQGDRLASIVGPGPVRLAAAVLLLSPGVPLLFMGEEYGETAPFAYFVDHADSELRRAVRRGRAEEMTALGWTEETTDPLEERTFRAAILDRSLRSAPGHAELWALYRSLIRLRRDHSALARSTRPEARAQADGDVVTLMRSDAVESVCSLFNFGAAEAEARLPAPWGEAGGPSSWTRLIDSTDPALGGHGRRQPEVVRAHDVVRLGPHGFCSYGHVAQ